MKTFYSIIFIVVMIAIITAGLKRSNAFFRDPKNLSGEVNYLTPAAAETADTTAKADTTKKADAPKEAYKEGQNSTMEEKH